VRLPSIHRKGAVPLGDIGSLGGAGKRTSAVRILLAAALAFTLVWLFIVAKSAGTGRAAVFPEGTTTGVIALDMSASISGPVYARVATTLRGIVNANQSIGLTMFSDTAYELLPPNSPPGALLQFVNFFVPVRYYGSSPVFEQSPWDTFSGGTRIGAGLEMARVALKRARIEHGAILLVSDLDDSDADQALLETEALKLHAEHIPVRIVPLFASPHDRQIFAALFGDKAFVNPSAFTHRANRRAAPIAAPQPWTLILAGLVLVALLAGNERFNARLSVHGAAS
jgi:hypothetical protein